MLRMTLPFECESTYSYLGGPQPGTQQACLNNWHRIYASKANIFKEEAMVHQVERRAKGTVALNVGPVRILVKSDN